MKTNIFLFFALFALEACSTGHELIQASTHAASPSKISRAVAQTHGAGGTTGDQGVNPQKDLLIDPHRVDNFNLEMKCVEAQQDDPDPSGLGADKGDYVIAGDIVFSKGDTVIYRVRIGNVVPLNKDRRTLDGCKIVMGRTESLSDEVNALTQLFTRIRAERDQVYKSPYLDNCYTKYLAAQVRTDYFLNPDDGAYPMRIVQYKNATHCAGNKFIEDKE